MPHSIYLPERMGTATISPQGAFEAGSFQSFTLVYTAGYFGIDDTGSIKIVHRFASDMGRPQWSDPRAANYTTVEAIERRGARSAIRRQAQHPALGQDAVHPRDARLPARRRHDHRASSATAARARRACAYRPSSSRRSSSACWSMPFATYNYVELPVQPMIAVVAGSAGVVEGGPADAAPSRAAFSPGFQGRGQLGQPERSGRRHLHAACQSGRSPACRQRSRCAAASTRSRSRTCRSLRREISPSRCWTTAAQLLCTSNPLRIADRSAAAAVLVRPARPIGGNDRHQLGARADRVRARPRVPRRHEPPGQ